MWLDKNGAGSYCKGFLAKDITGALLENMNVQTMNDCGVVLASEQTRLTRLIQNEKALRLARGENFGTDRFDPTADKTDLSVDDSMSTTTARSTADHHTARAIDVNNEEEDESLSEANTFKSSTKTPNSNASMSKRGGSSSTVRKTAITAKFVNSIRPPVNLIVSSASTSLIELRRVLRKKTGRKFDCHEMKVLFWLFLFLFLFSLMICF